ncbi:MAG: dienelactone hydrolase family protein [Ignavibacteriae bacterium]|nr:dienelactone hydrolase family protein [Ignavibacteriota bacterium]
MKSSAILLLITCYTASMPAQDFALKQLNDSPRHHEWVAIPSGKRSLHCFVAYPEKKEKSLVAIIIHENRGLTDWVRSFADQLAGIGYVAIAPDLLSGFDEKHSRTSDFNSSDDARNALYQLPPDQVTNDLLAVQKYASDVPSSNGKTVVIGFCWGGAQSFRLATNADDLSAALVFYGSSPDADRIPRITAPVYGFYAENDERINAGIPETSALMKKYGKTYDFVTYKGAGHAFMRSGDDPAGSKENRKARNDSWERLKKILSQIE